MKSNDSENNRIVFISNTSWSMYNFRMDVMKMFVGLGMEVYVLAPEDNYANRFALHGISFMKVSHLNPQGVSLYEDFSLFQELLQLLRNIRPAIVFSYTIKPNIYAVMAASRIGIPAIAVITGLGHAFSKKGMLAAVVKKMYRLSLRRARNAWFLNTDDYDYFTRNKLVNKNKSFALPGEGVNTDFFKRKVPYPNCATTKFLYAGRLLYTKGVGVFIDAIRLLRERGCAVVGELVGFTDTLNPSAISFETVRQWESEGVVRYLGSTDDVRPFIEQTNCFVFPSYYNEGIPRCLMEAASMEIPIITTDNVGCREVVDNGKTGFLCKIKDVESVADAMQRLIGLDINQRKLMGQHGREKMISEFSIARVLRIYNDAANEVMQKA